MLRVLLSLPFLLSAAAAIPAEPPSNLAPSYPLAHNGSVIVRDPDIIKHDGFYYVFGTGHGIPFHKSKSLDGPWEFVGPVLTKPSIIPKRDAAFPWAPTVLKKGNTFYCFYSVSWSGVDDSAIGVATTTELKSGWTDHGAIVQSGTGPGSDKPPFKGSNTIDPQVFIDHKDGLPYLNYGSYFSGLWQVPLKDDLMSLKEPEKIDAKHLATKPANEKPNAEEGPFMTSKNGYYYLWFSNGQCCNLDPKNLPPAGREYSIRVGRSKSVRGPFVDKAGKDLTAGGGTIVYGSNNDNIVYAPGGQGVLSDGPRDILYYHYLNTRVGVEFRDAYLGWNEIEYVNGWPVAK